MIHFVHTSDWHLGFIQYNKEERFNDFYRAAKFTVDKIIELNPQFVLHTGDLFHHTTPSPGAIRLAIHLLSELKKVGIPVYMIRGNHDAKTTKASQIGGTALDILSELKLINYVNDKLELVNRNTAIFGIGFYLSDFILKKIDEVLNENIESLKNQNYYRVLALHNFVEGHLDENFEISLSKIADLGFDYIGVGHHHIPWRRTDQNIFAPGSSESTSSNDWGRNDTINDVSMLSSFYEIKAELKESNWVTEVETHNIIVRPKIQGTIVTDAKNRVEIENVVKSYLSEKIELIEDYISELPKNKTIEKLTNSPIAHLVIKTTAPSEEIYAIDREAIKQHFNLLDAKLDFETTYVETLEKSAEMHSLHVKDVLSEISDELKQDEAEMVNLINILLSLFEDIPVSRQIRSDQIEEVVKSISESDYLVNSFINDDHSIEKKLTKKSKTITEKSMEEFF
jgi:DNA repair exonuclease SbcCD nuclease subunit